MGVLLGILTGCWFSSFTAAQAGGELDALKDQLRAIEATGNAYSPKRAEAVIQLASAMAENNFHHNAAELYKTALYIQRINWGLNNIALEPLLYQVVETSLRINDAESATNAVNQIVETYYYDDSVDAQSKLAIYLWAAQWHLAAYLQDIDIIGLHHLLDARSLLSIGLDLSVPGDPFYIRLRGGYAIVAHSLVIENYRLSQSGQSDERALSCETLNHSMMFDVQTSTSGGGVSCLERMVRTSRDLLDEAVRQAEADGNMEQAVVALLLRADWETVHGSRSNALSSKAADLYQLVWDQATIHSPQMVEHISQPGRLLSVELFGGVPDLESKVIEGDVKRDVQVVMRVTERGRSEDVKLLEGQDNIDSRTKNLALRSARLSMYRPAVRDGELVEVDSFVDTWSVNL